MSDRRFLDTNVQVYAHDQDEDAKQAVARQILRAGLVDRNAVVSSQVLSEFFIAVTRQIPDPLTVDEAQQAVAAL
jgi:predicted nucleic acid-binding protein